MTPSSKAMPALSRGLSFTAEARADRRVFEREAMATSRFDKPDSNARRKARFRSRDPALRQRTQQVRFARAAAPDSIVKQPSEIAPGIFVRRPDAVRLFPSGKPEGMERHEALPCSR